MKTATKKTLILDEHVFEDLRKVLQVAAPAWAGYLESIAMNGDMPLPPQVEEEKEEFPAPPDFTTGGTIEPQKVPVVKIFGPQRPTTTKKVAGHLPDNVDRLRFPEQPITMSSSKWEQPPRRDQMGSKGIGTVRAQQIKWFLNRDFSFEDIAGQFYTSARKVERIALGFDYKTANAPQSVPWFDGQEATTAGRQRVLDESDRLEDRLAVSRCSPVSDEFVALIRRAYIMEGSPAKKTKAMGRFKRKWAKMAKCPLATIPRITSNKIKPGVLPASTHAVNMFISRKTKE